MSQKTYQATVMVAGTGSGKPLILDEPLSLWGGLDPHTGIIIDQRHPQAGECVTDRVLILTAGRGSSSASSILLEAIKENKAPAAIITAEADAILTLGAVVAQEVYGVCVPVVVLGDYRPFCNTLNQQSKVKVEDQTVTIF